MTGLILIAAVQCIDESKSFFVDQTRMEGIGILKFFKKEISVKALPEIVFKEWLDYEIDYLGFSTADSFREEAEHYGENSYFGPDSTV